MPFQDFSTQSSWIALKRISLDAMLDVDAWGRKEKQRCVLTVQVLSNLSEAAAEDDWEKTIDYSQLNKDIRRMLSGEQGWLSLGGFARQMAKMMATHNTTSPSKLIRELHVQVELPDALLNSRQGVSCRFNVENQDFIIPEVRLGGIAVPCIIGIKDRERKRKQTLLVSMVFGMVHDEEPNLGPRLDPDWKQELATFVFEQMSCTSFGTAEAAAGAVRELVGRYFSGEFGRNAVVDDIYLTAVSVLKPSALAGVDGAGAGFSNPALTIDDVLGGQPGG